MVGVSHLFFFLRKYFRGRCDSGESHRPLSGTIYFPTAPFLYFPLSVLLLFLSGYIKSFLSTSILHCFLKNAIP